MTGCHVAAHDWATWHLYQPTKIGHLSFVDWPMCLPHQLPRHLPYCHIVGRTTTYHPVCLPHHPAMSPDDVTRATCHTSSGDTCHLGIRPTVPPYTRILLPRVTPWSCHMSLYGPAMCHCTNLPRVAF
jgi:hypothetical protein